MWFLVYWYNKQLCNLKCLISLDASTIWQFGKDGTGNLFNFLQESKIIWLKFSIQVYQAYECHNVHNPSKFGEDKTSKISYIRNAPESWIICQCQGNSKSFPFYLFGQSFLQSVHLSTEVIMHMHLGNVYGLFSLSSVDRNFAELSKFLLVLK